MSIIGTNVAQSLAGASQAERLEARDKKPASKLPTSPRKGDRDLYVSQVENVEAARGLSSNEQQDANEDHRKSNAYRPGGESEERPRLDVEG